MVQVTVLFTPITTVMDPGLKAKPWMVTLALLCAVAAGFDRVVNNPARIMIVTSKSCSELRLDGILISTTRGVKLCS